MYLQILGIGGAFSATYYNTSFLASTPSMRLLVDGPHSLLRLLRERCIEAESIDSILVTHVHGDHWAGAETLLLWRKYVLGSRTNLYTSRQVFEKAKHLFSGGFSETFSPDLQDIVRTRFEDFVDFHELELNGINRIAPDLAVEIRRNWHPTPALGLKIHLASTVIGISGDTCFDPALLEKLRQSGRITNEDHEKLAGDWLWHSDLVYHEASPSSGGGHTGEEALLALPPSIRSRIRLVHVPDDFQGTLPVAQEGEIVRVNGAGGNLVVEPPDTP
jgi:hypothetical protein